MVATVSILAACSSSKEASGPSSPKVSNSAAYGTQQGQSASIEPTPQTQSQPLSVAHEMVACDQSFAVFRGLPPDGLLEPLCYTDGGARTAVFIPERSDPGSATEQDLLLQGGVALVVGESGQITQVGEASFTKPSPAGEVQGEYLPNGLTHLVFRTSSGTQVWVYSGLGAESLYPILELVVG